MSELHKIITITRKELADYFVSSAALLFLGIFAGVSFFAFFWVETFFSRNIADVRPLFIWMPVLLIFLIAALTMRSWAEERRSGTIEIILTAPISPLTQILGKYFAVLLLVVIALALTLSLPITVSLLGDLDWGPVIGGYIAALFLTSAYIAIGLWASIRTENQIVSLILTVLIAGVLYAIGSQTFTSFFDYKTAELLQLFGSGSRFESITRGILDFRDLFYYLTITVIFLFLNRLSLEKLRWVGNGSNQSHKKWYKLSITLIFVLVIFNIGLNFTTKLRLDLTEGQIYSLSSTTKQYLKNLNNPLLIRAYFSSTTHPLLAPLIPRARDLLSEYAVAGGSKVIVEFVNPHENPIIEEEAGTKYGIRPVSFQTTNKYQASVVNTYFDILIEYEGQFEILSYKDLVEFKSSAGNNEVELKNPEYNISRTIRTAIAKSNRDIPDLNALIRSYAFTGYFTSNEKLPKKYQDARGLIEETISELYNESNGNIDALFIDPEDDEITAEYLANELKIRPHTPDTLETNQFWFYLSLSDGKNSVPVALPDKYSKDTIRKSLITAIKRLLPDSTKTVAFITPTAAPGPAGIVSSQLISKNFNILREALNTTVSVVDLELKGAKVPEAIDFLMVLAPRYLDPTYQTAIENFLFRGGTVLIATTPIDASISDIADTEEIDSGLKQWLANYGINFRNELVLDTQHGVLPIPSPRRVGGLVVRETKIVDYPYIIDIRGEGLNQDNVITSRLGQLYIPWAAPIEIDISKNQNRKVIPLLKSSNESWISNRLKVLPNFEKYPDLGFPRDNENNRSRNLAVMIEGKFKNDADKLIDGNIEKQSRLILVGSSSLFTDNFSDLMTQALRTEYRRPAQFAQNLVDWSIEDQGMLNVLHKHGHFTRTLETLENQDKKMVEIVNYVSVLLGLLIVYLISIMYKNHIHNRNKLILQKIPA